MMHYTTASQQLQSGQGGYASGYTIIISDVLSGYWHGILSSLFHKYYTMTQKVKQVTQNGPPQELICCITHLHNLLKNLPSSLPFNPAESQYCFGLDAEYVAEEGIWYAFNRNLESCFETHRFPVGGTIVFRERGPQLDDLIQTFKMAAKGLTTDMNWTFMQEVWLEKLIKAAEMQGANIPNKCVPNICFEIINAYQRAEEPKEAMIQKVMLNHLKSMLITPEKHTKVTHLILKSAMAITCQHQAWKFLILQCRPKSLVLSSK